MIDVKKLLRRAGGNDAASFEQEDTGSKKQGFAQIMRDEDNGFAEAPCEGAEFALKLGAGDRIESAEGLVHQQDWWISSKGASDAYALALASREFARPAPGVFARIETHKLEHFFDARSSAIRVPVFQGRDEGDVLRDGEMGEKAGILDDIPDAAAKADGVPIGGGAALDENLAV
jgi:hypothetical protein